MNCYKHVELPSVAACNGCRRALCSSCEGIARPPLCKQCAHGEAGRQQQSIITKYIPTLLGAVAGYVFAQVMSADKHPGPLLDLMMIYYFASIPSGWRILNAITPRMFLFMSLGGWVVYFIVKGGLSMFIGVFAFPFGVAMDIAAFFRARQLSAHAALAD